MAGDRFADEAESHVLYTTRVWRRGRIGEEGQCDRPGIWGTGNDLVSQAGKRYCRSVAQTFCISKRCTDSTWRRTTASVRYSST